MALLSLAGADSGYAPVNGLKMYYEIHGSGEPLVLIHGGGSTIQTTFGAVLPAFAKGRKVIAMELQGHGHTGDINRPLSFEQDADDVAALLKYLKIEKADIFGFSNGGNTAMQLAIRHPQLVRKLIIGSAFYKQSGIHPQVLASFPHATADNMPPVLKNAYLQAAPDPSQLSVLVSKLMKRLLEFKDWNPADIRAIKAPALIMAGNNDVAKLEDTIELLRLFPHAQLMIFPGGHGTYIGEVTGAVKGSKLPELAVQVMEEFLAGQ
ncbi:alpha/beta fold hydrolase [Chitinophaga sp. SYP-B3965]|uniref:alpha/beta fold hydrolase n=1 Tax=Chitinophaga sp. SYP-B3965 TaxID=2663120 RepID=UPI0012996EF7|nr:alpha/beta hydrolase [Chitinophaga sp. SYP-B3965]MRG44144.1 alpha/beta fold hydrolase [Chitinophaga sp. SYP-B3965]